MNNNPTLTTPHNLEAERGCIGVLFTSPDDFGKIATLLQPDDFFLPVHRFIFESMNLVWEAGHGISLITVTESVKTNGHWGEIGGDWSADDYIRGLLEFDGQPAKAEEYAEIVRSMSLRRKMLLIAKFAETEALKEGADGDRVVRETESAMQGLFEGRLVAQVTELPPLIDERLAEAAKRQQRGNTGLLTGLSTGFDTLDYITSGLQPRTLNIVAARPGVGKSAISLQIADHVATDLGLSVMFFSLEMGSEELADRLIVYRSGIDSQRWKTGMIREDEWKILNGLREKVKDSRLFICDNAGMSVGDMWNQCRRIHKREGLSLVVIDYVQLMKGRDGQGRQNEVSEISRSLKLMSKDLDVPLIALCQLNRNVENRPNGRPQLSDIRESGSLENDADMVAFIHDPSRQSLDEMVNTELILKYDIIIAKHRNGPRGDFQLGWHTKQAKFVEIDEHHQPMEYNPVPQTERPLREYETDKLHNGESPLVDSFFTD